MEARPRFFRFGSTRWESRTAAAIAFRLRRQNGRPVASDFPNAHFRDFAAAIASRFVAQKKLREGEFYSYMVVAHPAPPETQNDRRSLGCKRIAERAGQRRFAQNFLARATPSGVIDIDDMPVFVSRRVLEEAAERTHAEEGTETGGILIGVLWRDPIAGEIFAEITAQIPAEHTSGSNVKLTFTPQTWAAADAALRLRRRGEIYLGYWHSHPVRAWCKGKACTLEAQKIMPLGEGLLLRRRRSRDAGRISRGLTA